MNWLCASSIVSFSESVESHTLLAGAVHLRVADRRWCSLFNAADKLPDLKLAGAMNLATLYFRYCG